MLNKRTIYVIISCLIHSVLFFSHSISTKSEIIEFTITKPPKVGKQSTKTSKLLRDFSQRRGFTRFLPDSPIGSATKNGSGVKDLDSGADLLQVDEFKYQSFYHRAKAKIESYWQPIAKKVLLGKHVRLPVICQIEIVLTPSGKLISAKIKTNSEYLDLDATAVEALNQVAILNNPPADLVKNGVIIMIWDFEII